MLPVHTCPLQDGDECLPQLSRLSLCVLGRESLWMDHQAPLAKMLSPWDRCPACASLAWRSHLPLDGVKRIKVCLADFTKVKGILLTTAFITHYKKLTERNT